MNRRRQGRLQQLGIHQGTINRDQRLAGCRELMDSRCDRFAATSGGSDETDVGAGPRRNLQSAAQPFGYRGLTSRDNLGDLGMLLAPGIQPLPNRDGVLQFVIDLAIGEGTADGDGQGLITTTDTNKSNFKRFRSMVSDRRRLNSQRGGAP